MNYTSPGTHTSMHDLPMNGAFPRVLMKTLGFISVVE